MFFVKHFVVRLGIRRFLVKFHFKFRLEYEKFHQRARDVEEVKLLHYKN